MVDRFTREQVASIVEELLADGARTDDEVRQGVIDRLGLPDVGRMAVARHFAAKWAEEALTV